MDYKCTCKRRRHGDVLSHPKHNMVYIELHVAKSQNNNYTCNQITVDMYYAHMYLNAFLGNVLCYIFLPIYAVIPRLFLARDTTLPSDQCLLGVGLYDRLF